MDVAHKPGRSFVGFPRTLVIAVGPVLAALGLLALRQGNAEFVLYAVALVIEIALVTVLHRRVGLSGPVLWCLAIWAVLHMAGGTVPAGSALLDAGASKPVLYGVRLHPWTPRYDQIVHAFGFFAATLAAWEAIVSFMRPDQRPGVGQALAAALVGMGLGAVNEVIEFVMTLTLPETGVGGYTNTGWDLVSNTVGSTAAALVCFVWRRAHGR
ncbi:MAG: DUF2238 domain-containing protein [Phycisphaeraceae bacterium]|nr:MAG: DUF2238 domain-containing protein [Phycisphaeraceae bacterium]